MATFQTRFRCPRSTHKDGHALLKMKCCSFFGDKPGWSRELIRCCWNCCWVLLVLFGIPRIWRSPEFSEVPVPSWCPGCRSTTWWGSGTGRTRSDKDQAALWGPSIGKTAWIDHGDLNIWIVLDRFFPTLVSRVHGFTWKPSPHTSGQSEDLQTFRCKKHQKPIVWEPDPPGRPRSWSDFAPKISKGSHWSCGSFCLRHGEHRCCTAPFQVRQFHFEITWM